MIRRALQATVLVTAVATSFAAEAERKGAPAVSPGGIVNAAGFATGPDGSVAPGSIVAIFGVELAEFDRAAGPGDLVGATLPKLLAGVEVRINSQPAPLYFVSPNQINCQIPVSLRIRDAPYELRVVHNNEASPEAPLLVRGAAPGLFPVVTHQDFSLVGRGDGASPAAPGELIVLFGSGFGETFFPLNSGQIATQASPVIAPSRVLLNDVALAPERLLYVGAAPGFAGLYQVNLLLPDDTVGPEVLAKVEVGGVTTPVGVPIAVDDRAILEPHP